MDRPCVVRRDAASPTSSSSYSPWWPWSQWRIARQTFLQRTAHGSWRNRPGSCCPIAMAAAWLDDRHLRVAVTTTFMCYADSKAESMLSSSARCSHTSVSSCMNHSTQLSPRRTYASSSNKLKFSRYTLKTTLSSLWEFRKYVSTAKMQVFEKH
jgi:hypothetical protein